jgi:hypothetical protein
MVTEVNDLVLVYINNKPAFFARIEDIEPDVKTDWWQVTLLVLQVPVKTLVWILRDAYIQGEHFTMGGTPIRLEKVVVPPATFEPDPDTPNDDREETKDSAQIISLSDHRKK